MLRPQGRCDPSQRPFHRDRLKDDHGAARAVALDVKPVVAHVDHLAGCGLGGATSGRSYGREGTADGHEHEGGDHRDDEPAAAAVEVPSHLHEHPDGEGGERRGPDPTEQVHRGRTGLEHDQAEPGDAEESAGTIIQVCGWAL